MRGLDKDKSAFQNKSGIKLWWFLILIIVLMIGFWAGRSMEVRKSRTQTTVTKPQVETQIWTCSMHPQIRLPKPGLCPICNMKLILLVVPDEAADADMRQLTVSENAKRLMEIEVTPVERKSVSAIIRMVGKVDYDETNVSNITAWVPGRINKLYVNYTGVHVNKGDRLANFYSPELIVAQEELLQAIEAGKKIQKTQSSVIHQMTESTVDSAREKLRLLGLMPEQIAEIERTGQVTDHITIYSPASGIVIHKNALEGMYVQTGTRIFTIADLSKVWVQLDAYESNLEWLRYGQEVEFTSVSHPGKTFTGVISFIPPVLDEKTRTVKIRVNVANPDGILKPGMFVKALVKSEITGDKTEQIRKPLVIPVSAPLITGTRAIVYVQVPGTQKPTYEGREVVLGSRGQEYYIVEKGLREGELVVVKGSFKIDSSLQLMARPSMMTPESADEVVSQETKAKKDQ